MNELDKYLPAPPNVGPPLPRILQARWPWVTKPPQRQYVLPIIEEPEVIVEPQETEPSPTPLTPAAVTPSYIVYEIECPPE